MRSKKQIENIRVVITAPVLKKCEACDQLKPDVMTLRDRMVWDNQATVDVCSDCAQILRM